MKKLKVVPGFSWRVNAQFMTVLHLEKDSLSIVVQEHDGMWLVLSLETATKNTHNIDAVFDNHAHKHVGNYQTPAEALSAAESFGKSWLKKHKVSLHSTCDCSEIA